MSTHHQPPDAAEPKVWTAEEAMERVAYMRALETMGPAMIELQAGGKDGDTEL